MTIPDDRLYSRQHEWCRFEDDHAVLGITPYAIRGMGQLVCLELPEAGDDLLHDVAYAEIEGMRKTCSVFSLIDGVVLEINGRVAHNPDLLTKDPFGEGWMIKVRLISDAHSGETLTAEQYRQVIGKKGR